LDKIAGKIIEFSTTQKEQTGSKGKYSESWQVHRVKMGLYQSNFFYCVLKQVLSKLVSVLSLVLSKCNQSYCPASRLGVLFNLNDFYYFCKFSQQNAILHFYPSHGLVNFRTINEDKS